MRRVSHGELIGLLRGALRAAELQAETCELKAEAALMEAGARAHALLQARHLAVGDVDGAVRDELLTALPLTGEGRLHEPAFLALVEALIWSRRDQEMAALAGPRGA